MQFNGKHTEIMMFGAFPLVAKTLKRETVSSLPTISSKRCGRYFSILKIEEVIKVFVFLIFRRVDWDMK